MVSFTVSSACNKSSCSTYAEMPRKFCSSRGSPLTITRPVKLDVAAAALGTRHAKMLSKLVFPHPVGPMMASNSPLSSTTLTVGPNTFNPLNLCAHVLR